MKPIQVTNEPGVYFEGHLGLRIENDLIILPEHTQFGEVLRFETVSPCLSDPDFEEPSFLEGNEIAWLNAYHQWVKEALAPWLSGEEYSWLQRETREL
jgi:Xaa-Pro aminopeptidase